MAAIDRKAELVVVGGGITGMWAALEAAKQGHDVALVTADLTGGLITTVNFAKGARADLGGHVYTARDQRVVDLMEAAGGTYHERQAVYMGDDGYVPYPVQDHPDLLGTVIKPEPSFPDDTLEGWARNRFGGRFLQDWYNPFNERVWTIETHMMSSDWVKDRVKAPTESKEAWGPNASFIYAPGSSIVDVMLQRLEEAGVNIIVGYVESADVKARRLDVTEPNMERMIVGYDTCIWTIHPGHLADQVQVNVPLVSNILHTLAIYSDVSPDTYDWHWAYGNIGSHTHRITNLARYHHTIAPRGRSVFILELPYRPGFNRLPSFALSVDTATKKDSYSVLYIHEESVREWLRDAGLNELIGSATYARVLRFVGYPIPLLGLRDRMAELKRALFGHGITVAGRWGDWGYYNVEHCMTSAEHAIRALGAPLPYDEYLHSSFYYARSNQEGK